MTDPRDAVILQSHLKQSLDIIVGLEAAVYESRKRGFSEAIEAAGNYAQYLWDGEPEDLTFLRFSFLN